MRIFLKPACLVLLLGVSSCDKVKQLGDFAKKAKSKSSETAKSLPEGTAVTEANYDDFTRQPGRLILIDFTATWCGPCRQMAPMLDKIVAEKNGSIILAKVDIDQHGALAKREGVSGIPDVRVFLDGKQVDKFVGVPPESELRKRIESQLANLFAVAPATGALASPAEKVLPIAPAPKDWMPKGMQRR